MAEKELLYQADNLRIEGSSEGPVVYLAGMPYDVGSTNFLKFSNTSPKDLEKVLEEWDPSMVQRAKTKDIDMGDLSFAFNQARIKLLQQRVLAERETNAAPTMKKTGNNEVLDGYQGVPALMPSRARRI